MKAQSKKLAVGMKAASAYVFIRNTQYGASGGTREGIIKDDASLPV